MRGIILAGGSGSRLYPSTVAVSKQLLPVFDKPMIFYPLSTLMLSGVREVCIIVRPQDRHLFERLLGNGSQWGMSLVFKEQATPAGLPEAYILAEDFLNGSRSALILGDNIFHGAGFGTSLRQSFLIDVGAKIFVTHVDDPSSFGVFNPLAQPPTLVEKPSGSSSKLAVTGLYLADGTAADRARDLLPSPRGELEITDFLRSYLSEGKLEHSILSRGASWFDAGTPVGLLESSEYIHAVQKMQSAMVSCPEEIAWRNGWISDEELAEISRKLPLGFYGSYLDSLLASRDTNIACGDPWNQNGARRG